MRTDFENLRDGDVVKLYPNAANPLHRRSPIVAEYAAGYFFVRGDDPADGPAYYFGDVLRYNDGVEMEDSA